MPTFLLLKVEVFEVVKVSVPIKPESVNVVVAVFVASYTLFAAEAVAVKALVVTISCCTGLICYSIVINICSTIR